MSDDASTWTCAICGEHHQGLATVFGPPAPEPWLEATRRQRRRGEINDDLCAFEDDAGRERYFLRGHLEIKAPDLEEGQFIWSVWVELDADGWDATGRHWDDPDRDQLLPLPGILATDLPYPKATRGLGVRVFTRPPGVVPFIKLDRSQEHPLVDEQRKGISAHRVAELNDELLGGS